MNILILVQYSCKGSFHWSFLLLFIPRAEQRTTVIIWKPFLTWCDWFFLNTPNIQKKVATEKEKCAGEDQYIYGSPFLPKKKSLFLFLIPFRIATTFLKKFLVILRLDLIRNVQIFTATDRLQCNVTINDIVWQNYDCHTFGCKINVSIFLIQIAYV